MSRLFSKRTPEKGESERPGKKGRIHSPPEAMEATPGKQQVEINMGSDLTTILESMSTKLDKLDGIDTKVCSIESTVKELKQSVDFAIKTADEAKSMASASQSKCDSLEKSVCVLEAENKKLHSKLDDVTEQVLRVESQSRRSNLNFDGIREEKNEKPEDTLRIFRGLLASTTIPNVSDIKIERCHRRPGPKGKPKPIIVKFTFFDDRQLVWKNREELNAKNVWVRQDFPKIYEERRAKFRPVLKAAKIDPRYNGRDQVYITVDKLVVDGKTYSHNQLDTLPDGLKPHQIATRVVNNMTLFYHKESPFSNFHPSRFVKDGESYSCVEQYFQAKKAAFFDDDLSVQKIRSTDDPYEHYRLGQKVSNFNDAQWISGPAVTTMEEALFAKFSQNNHLRQALLATQGTELAECSPTNKFWGTGMSLTHAHAAESSRWSGQNKLGTLLTVVRQKLSSST